MTTTRTRSTPHSESPLPVPPMNAPGREERLLDQAIAESFPASDPISPAYEASLEPVLLENTRSREIWKRRLRKATPSLLALGGAAIVALAAVYLLRNERSGWRRVKSSLRLNGLADRLHLGEVADRLHLGEVADRLHLGEVANRLPWR